MKSHLDDRVQNKRRDSKSREEHQDSQFSLGSASLDPPSFQLKSSEEEEEIQMKPVGSPQKHEKAKQSDFLSKMESSFDTSFSDVKFHQNSSKATDVGALAFTQGTDIHFAPGQFNPDTPAGQQLIGHELTHVIQQRNGRVKPTTEVNGQPVNDDKKLEAEADAMAKKVAQGRRPSKGIQEFGSMGPASSGQKDQPIQRLTLYAHGFIPDRDFFGNEKRQDQGETIDDNDYNGYWGDIDESFGKSLGDGNMLYFDGSANAVSSAQDRVAFGRNAADLLYQRLQNKELSVATNDQGAIIEPITIVGHSMGGAYAAGMGERLLEINAREGKTIFNVQTIYYLAPHQPMDFDHPSTVRGVQYSHANDAISSRGIVPAAAGSKLGPIGGIGEYLVHDKPGLNRKILGDNAERGGHNVHDHDYIFDLYEEGESGFVAPIDDPQNVCLDQDLPDVEGRAVHLPKALDWTSEKYNQAKDWTSEKYNQAKDWTSSKYNNTKKWSKRKLKNGKKWASDKWKKFKGLF